MSPLAWVIFLAFLVWVVADGVRRSARSSTLEDYYAGGRKIPWWAAGLSVMATQASAITIIGTTGEGHEGGLSFVQFYFGLPFAMIALCVWLVPIYRRLPILTVYEYLERRFDSSTRALASLVFLASRCLALGVVITAPSVVMSATLGWPLEWTIVMVGALTTFYTVFGGVSAVVWTDVKQMTVILVGLVICFFLLAREVFGELGVEGALRAAGAAGRLAALEVVPQSLDFVPRAAGETIGSPSFWEQKYTLWTGLIGGFFLQLSYFGCDQSQAQRILVGRDANESRRAMLISAFAKVPMQLFVLAIGVLLWLFHATKGEPLLFRTDDRAAAVATDPDELARREVEFQAAHAARRAAMLALPTDGDRLDPSDPRVVRYRETVAQVASLKKSAAIHFNPRKSVAEKAAGQGKEDVNFIFVHWILNNLHPVLLGLIVAAIFAAAMSSVDSVLNALSAATIVDFYRRWWRPNASERSLVIAGRVTTMLWGVVATITAIVMISGSSIIEQVNRVGSFFYGSLLGVFLLGIFVRSARGRAGFVGLVGGMLSVLTVHTFWRVEFLWYNAIGVLGVLVFGMLASWLWPQINAGSSDATSVSTGGGA